LIKGLDYRTIADTLKVSPATVVTYGLLFHKRQTKLVEIIKNMLLKEKALGFLEDLFAELFIQPGLKIGHHQLKWEHKKRKREREVLG
ncbi:hypothetical protein HY612_05445, partial [Candidatus Roizmanbacteria bacterium]|nr:hypothetical protein [Candidatus Roizmanbacteria bacterium]